MPCARRPPTSPASTSPEPAVAVPANCSGEAPEQAPLGNGNTPAELNGTYRYVLTKEDARKSGETDLSLYPNTNTWILKDGHFSTKGDYGGFTGSYSVHENRITFAATGSPTARTRSSSTAGSSSGRRIPGGMYLVNSASAMPLASVVWK